MAEKTIAKFGSSVQPLELIRHVEASFYWKQSQLGPFDLDKRAIKGGAVRI